MSPKLQQHLSRRGIVYRPDSGGFLAFHLCLCGLLSIIAANHVVAMDEIFYAICLMLLELFLGYAAGCELGTLRQLHQLRRSSRPIDKNSYVRIIFSVEVNPVFFASPAYLVWDLVENLAVLAVLLAGGHYVGITFLVILIVATDRIFEDNIDFVRHYVEMVERS